MKNKPPLSSLIIAIGVATATLLLVPPITLRAALVVADTATELALGQARQMPKSRPPGLEPLPDVQDVVADHAGLLGPGTEEALARELSRVWVNQNIEVFIRTVDRDAISWYEPNALKIIRGHSGNGLVLVFTESPFTYLFVLSDKLSQTLGLDGVRRSVQNAMQAANNKRPADARIIATVVALLQQIVKETGASSQRQTTADNTAPAASPEPSPQASAAADPKTESQQTPSGTPSESPQPARDAAPPPSSPDETQAEALPTLVESPVPDPSIAPTETGNETETSATSQPQPTNTRSSETTSVSKSGMRTPPVKLLYSGGAAALLLLALFSLRKLRTRPSGEKLSINAPPPPRKGPAEQKTIDFRGTVKGGLPEVKPAKKRHRSSEETEETARQTSQPLAATEKAFSNKAEPRSVSEAKFETRRDKNENADDSATGSKVSQPIVARQRREPPSETKSSAAEIESAAESEKITPTRTPLLRTMGMEPDQQDAKLEKHAKTESDTQTPPKPQGAASARDDEALLERIESYVMKMRRAGASQRVEMLRGLEILVLAYREIMGERHPEEKQLEPKKES